MEQGNKAVAAGPPAKAGARSAVNNAGWNSFGTLWSIAIAFLIAPILIRRLGVDQYGLLLLVWSLTGLMGLAGLGFGEATLKYVAHHLAVNDIAGANRIMGATMTFYLAIAGIVSVGLVVAVPVVLRQFEVPVGEHGTAAWLVKIAVLIWLVRAVFTTHAAVPMALQRYDITTKIGVVHNILRSAGFIVLALSGFGVIYLVLWDLACQVAVFIGQTIVVRRLAPGVHLWPSLSLVALREIVGFSVFSFLTYGFLMLQRESAKLILAAKLGTAPVAYLGTPDNVALRIHMVVASGSETLMARFSANRDPEAARSLLWYATWSSLVVSLVFLVPLAVLMPDFLRLWISPEFATKSATLGQLVAISYITQGAYTPIAAYFRGTGQPSKVTIVIAGAGILTLVGSLVLIPRIGVVGAGFAYLLGSLATLVGTIHGWIHVFGRTSARGLVRVLLIPLIAGALAFAIQHWIRLGIDDPTWLGLFGIGTLFFISVAALIVGSDWILGGVNAPSKEFVRKVICSGSRRLLRRASSSIVRFRKQ